MKDNWVQLKELLGRNNFPKTIQGITYKAKAENWERRRVLGVKGRIYEYKVPCSLGLSNSEQRSNLDNSQIDLITYSKIAKQEKGIITLEFDSKSHVLVPELNIRVAAGNGVYPLDEDEEQIGQFIFSKQWLIKEGLSNAKLATFNVVGDSMETTINDGDIILVNVKEEGWTGALDGVFVILLNDMLFVKRLQFDMIENGFHIISDNPTYKPYFVKFDEGITFKAVAKVERVLTRMRQARQL